MAPVNAVADAQRKAGHAQVLEGHPVKLFGAALVILLLLIDHKPRNHPQDFVLKIEAAV